MKHVRGTVVAMVGVAALALAMAGTAAAAGPNGGGVIGCGGSSTELVGGTQGNSVYTLFQFINFNDSAAISIDRMVVYADAGNVVCDWSFIGKGGPMPLDAYATTEVQDDATLQHLGISSVACKALSLK